MLAFVTGASSGIGREIAKVLGKMGYDLIITARDEEKLKKLAQEVKTNVKIILADLASEKEVFELCEKVKDEKIDIFINNAGFGIIGNFWETSLETELEMLKVNNIAMHILFKNILIGMQKRNSGYILNVASLAGFMPGPLMSAYYASKAYVLNLTRGVYKELKMAHSNVHVSVLCPGPVRTNFADRAGVKFKIKELSSEYTAQYAIKKLLNKKLVIVPGFINKCGHVSGKIAPSRLSMVITYRIQRKKINQ